MKLDLLTNATVVDDGCFDGCIRLSSNDSKRLIPKKEDSTKNLKSLNNNKKDLPDKQVEEIGEITTTKK